MRITILGRAGNRWRVRLERVTVHARSYTLGLLDENRRPLGPAVVVSPEDPTLEENGFVEVELRGPCTLPSGAVIHCTADVDNQPPLHFDQPIGARRGFQSFLHADTRLPVESTSNWLPLCKADFGRLAQALPWLCKKGARKEHRTDLAAPVPDLAPLDGPGDVPSCEDDLLAMLKDDFGVDVDDLDADVFRDR